MSAFNVSCLLSPQPPWHFMVVADHSKLTNFAWSIQNSDPTIAVRIVRGGKMATTQKMFDEFSAAMQFPYYFGYNWAAFDECLADLEWLPASAYVVIVRDTLEILKGDEGELAVFIKVMQKVCEEWSTPVAEGQLWDRPSTAFHVLFHSLPTDANRVLERLQHITQTIHQLDLEG